MQLLVSPWVSTFETFARSISRQALMVSPFITAEPLRQLAEHLQAVKESEVAILTNLSIESMVQGATSPRALVDFCRSVPSTKIRNLPGLHAKVYVADRHTAIITSANLTRGGLVSNYEYGIQITDSELVKRIVDDLESYGALGAEVSWVELSELAEVAEDLQKRNTRLLESATKRLHEEFQEKVAEAKEALLFMRAKSGESSNAIFSRTISYILRNGALTTQQLHPLIQRTHPDLCDDTIDRVINGVHFGKRWKHMVRNAQQSLQRHGLICLNAGKWELTQ